jgi:FixJ family two-component response regulator
MAFDLRLRHVNVSLGDAKDAVMQGSMVTVVDDDESVRESLPDLLGEFGYASTAFASAESFLASDDVRKTQCLILDITMPGMSGPDLHRELRRQGHSVPVIFITAQRDEAVHAGLHGPDVVACLFKPFSDTALLEALNTAFRCK